MVISITILLLFVRLLLHQVNLLLTKCKTIKNYFINLSLDENVIDITIK